MNEAELEVAICSQCQEQEDGGKMRVSQVAAKRGKTKSCHKLRTVPTSISSPEPARVLGQRWPHVHELWANQKPEARILLPV